MLRSFSKMRQTASLLKYTQSVTASARVFSTDNFMSGANANYIEAMQEQWQRDPTSVHASWQAYFSGGSFEAPPTLGKNAAQGKLDEILHLLQSGAGVPSATSGAGTDRAAKESVAIATLINAYETHGHLLADVDPLDLQNVYKDIDSFANKLRMPPGPLLELLNPSTYGLTQADLDREFLIDFHNKRMSSILQQKKVWKLRDLIEAYKTAYCGKIGVEFKHIPSVEICNWIRLNFEGRQYNRMNDEEKLHLYDRLNWSHDFGLFLTQKFNTMKRFGLEGCESFIPGLKVMIDTAVENGASNFVIGMPHRGRINVLANVVRKPMEVIMAEFQGVKPVDDDEHKYSDEGDVKYHLGTSFTRNQKLQSGKTKEVTITLLANPSHLEAVNPVVMGRTRALQHSMGGSLENRNACVPIIVHGDAAMAGQGVVFEQLQMQSLPNYNVGGTIHVVVNNQVGFTTTPNKGRSGIYATDVAKAINAPVFHVNADSMEDVQRTFKFAAEYRQKFRQDVVVDLIGYRKFGHNELDQPSFTQPLMYKVIADHTPARDIYRKQLIEQGIAEDKLVALE